MAQKASINSILTSLKRVTIYQRTVTGKIKEGNSKEIPEDEEKGNHKDLKHLLKIKKEVVNVWIQMSDQVNEDV